MKERRVISKTPRTVLPIIGRPWRIRTFHGARRWLVDGAREPFTLDRVVVISLPRLLWLERSTA